MSGNRFDTAVEDSLNHCLQFADRLEKQRRQLLDLLTEFETYTAAQDEIERSIYCLLTIKTQARSIEEVRLNCACAYLPINQPLYAFVLNVFLLKLVSEKVYYRPPEKFRVLHRSIYLLFKDLFKDIVYCEHSRKDFLLECVSKSDVVVFTGKYENAVSLQKELPATTLMIYNGSALNPIIITPSANISQSVAGSINARLYNSGQDCMAPAGILVHKSVYPLFVKQLICELKKVKVGSNQDKDVLVGPMISDEYIQRNRMLLQKYHDLIIFGGKEVSEGLFTPTVFHVASDDYEHQIISYAPFFFLQEFQNNEDIQRYLSTPKAMLYKGYVSVFGNMAEANAISKLGLELNILRNSTLFDHESGNLEFGGYGEGCSFVYSNRNVTSKPILLLQDIKNWYLRHR